MIRITIIPAERGLDPVTGPRWRTAVLSLLLGLGTASCGGPSPEETARAQTVFQTCATCHGAEGQGDRELGAPNIAGLPAWYVRNQLRKFQIGHRAYVSADTLGQRMAAAVASALTEPGDMEVVATYVQRLPAASPPVTVRGDAGAGRVAYQACISCHERDGSGRRDKNAPPLPGLADWYFVSSLRDFRRGWRGTNANDQSGTTMRPVTIPLSDAEVDDLAAYVATLR